MSQMLKGAKALLNGVRLPNHTYYDNTYFDQLSIDRVNIVVSAKMMRAAMVAFYRGNQGFSLRDVKEGKNHDGLTQVRKATFYWRETSQNT